MPSKFEEALKALDSIETHKIELNNCSLKVTDIESLAKKIQKHPTLRELYLRNTGIDNVGLSHLSVALSRHPSLEVLDMANNQISDAGIGGITAILSTNRILLELNLERNKDLTDKSANEIAAALKHNQTLIKLDICDTGIRDEGIKAFVSVFQGDKLANQSLLYFVIGFNLTKDREVISQIVAIKRDRESMCQQFFKYCCEGKLTELQQQIDKGISLNLADERLDTDRNTGLHHAAKAGHYDVVNLLVANGARQRHNKQGQLPQQLAQQEATKLIKAENADNTQQHQNYIHIISLLSNRPGESRPVAWTMDEISALRPHMSSKQQQQFDMMRQGVERITMEDRRYIEQLDREMQEKIQDLNKKLSDIKQPSSASAASLPEIDKLQKQKIENGLARLTGIETLLKKPNIKLFHRTISRKLEEVFIGYKAVASHLINPNKGDIGKTATGVMLLGKAAALVPMYGNTAESVLNTTSQAMEVYDRMRRINKFTKLSRVATLEELNEISKRVAEELIIQYQYPLSLLYTLDEKKQKSDEIKEYVTGWVYANAKDLVKKTTEFVLSLEKQDDAELLAEYAAQKILQAIQDGKIKYPKPYKSRPPLHEQFLQAVYCKHSYFKTAKEGLISHVFRQNLLPNKHNQGAWQYQSFFRKPYIVVYSPDATKYEIYGDKDCKHEKNCHGRSYAYRIAGAEIAALRQFRQVELSRIPQPPSTLTIVPDQPEETQSTNMTLLRMEKTLLSLTPWLEQVSKEATDAKKEAAILRAEIATFKK